jgi:GNAT superfamily N-acetyltransferase
MPENNTVHIRQLTAQDTAALQLPNEPFLLHGRMIVTRDDSAWHYRIEETATTTLQTFPEEHYQYAEIAEKGFALGAFTGDVPVGLAIYQAAFFKYLYLDDLKVSQAFRHQGIARQLLAAAIPIAKHHGYAGVSTIGQDNNIDACQFYLANGFRIGGLNTRDYNHTVQEGKSDIYFYWDF